MKDDIEINNNVVEKTPSASECSSQSSSEWSAASESQSQVNYLSSQLRVDLFIVNFPTRCLQCFDAVGWVAGRASGL